jgi:hypothetical protein
MSQKTIPKLFDFMDDETFARIYDLNVIFFSKFAYAERSLQPVSKALLFISVFSSSWA